MSNWQSKNCVLLAQVQLHISMIYNFTYRIILSHIQTPLQQETLEMEKLLKIGRAAITTIFKVFGMTQLGIKPMTKIHWYLYGSNTLIFICKILLVYKSWLNHMSLSEKLWTKNMSKSKKKFDKSRENVWMIVILT